MQYLWYSFAFSSEASVLKRCSNKEHRSRLPLPTLPERWLPILWGAILCGSSDWLSVGQQQLKARRIRQTCRRDIKCAWFLCSQKKKYYRTTSSITRCIRVRRSCTDAQSKTTLMVDQLEGSGGSCFRYLAFWRPLGLMVPDFGLEVAGCTCFWQLLPELKGHLVHY